jgi:pantetheine-phosphate adenylyltransferase
MGKEFKTVAVGGTFDELHSGHKALLMKAFEIGDHVLVGLCSDAFARKLDKPHEIAPYTQRLEDLKAFLQEHGVLERIKIVALNDAYGVTLSRGRIEALVVSRETEHTALEINKKRKELGLIPLKLVVIDMVPSENHLAISTTRIRSGEIDREGRLLKQRENQ